MEEANQFREDVAYLTDETTRLMAELETERVERARAEDDVKRLTNELTNYQNEMP